MDGAKACIIPNHYSFRQERALEAFGKELSVPSHPQLTKVGEMLLLFSSSPCPHINPLLHESLSLIPQ